MKLLFPYHSSANVHGRIYQNYDFSDACGVCGFGASSNSPLRVDAPPYAPPWQSTLMWAGIEVLARPEALGPYPSPRTWEAVYCAHSGKVTNVVRLGARSAWARLGAPIQGATSSDPCSECGSPQLFGHFQDTVQIRRSPEVEQLIDDRGALFNDARLVLDVVLAMRPISRLPSPEVVVPKRMSVVSDAVGERLSRDFGDQLYTINATLGT